MGAGFKTPGLQLQSPPHAHHTTYETVAFYQLRDDKWVALHSPVDESIRPRPVGAISQAVFAEKHLPKGGFLASA